LAYDLRAPHIITVMMHPGWVQTDMGGSGASLPVERAVREMLRTIDTLTLADTARYLQYDGSDLPW
jgi:NAD(P)-dependent dehydrogenase (short-subunit alcohol dehydrogenase family)